MVKAQPHAGPSRPPPGRPLKVINKTVDLIKRNAGDRAKGKGKEKEVLGGVVNLVDEVKRLPGMIHVEKLAEARAMEIHAFQSAIKAAAAQGSTRAFQSLPRHLRRRAASHNPRRVPKRLRSRAAAEIDAGDNISQKHRKRAKQVSKGSLRDRLSRTQQFALRQRNKTWLPTHLWHAKRYHMTNTWGYRLPITPTMKSFRPAYRAGRRKAIAWDTSCFGILEIEGDREEILQVMRSMVGSSFAGEKYEMGGRSAQVTLYHPDTFPRGLIGPAEIIWQPHPEDGADQDSHTAQARRVWVRLHPSIFNEVWDAIKLALSQVPSTSRDQRDPLRIRDLRGDVDSLEINGPHAAKKLRRILRICKSESGIKRSFFEELARINPAGIPEGTVVGLKVHDPRLHFPPARLADVDAEPSSDDVLRLKTLEPSAKLARTLLWDENVRESLSKARYTKYQLDARRHKLGMPGSKLVPTAKDDRIPLLLIRRAIRSSSNGSEGEAFHGFTILLPSGWIMYFLSSLVYASTFIGGLEERRVQHREAGVPCFPEHFGSTCAAGKKWEEEKGRKEQERWERKPPGKRAEYGVLGTKSPFVPDWQDVMTCNATDSVEEQATNGSSGTTVRPWLLSKPFTSHLTSALNPTALLAQLNAFRKQRHMTLLPKDKAEKLYDSALVHVELRVLSRGSPGDMAMIYLLSPEQRGRWIEALEQQCGDTHAGEVSELHSPPRRIQSSMTYLQLGEKQAEQKDIIGYTFTGNFSLSRGKGHALGSITLKGYIELLRAATTVTEARSIATEPKVESVSVVRDDDGWTGRCLVRVRNRDGRVARLAEVVIVS